MSSGGGGGDGGYAERQAQIEAEKADARKKLNYLFGVGSPADNIDKTKYYHDVTTSTVPAVDAESGAGSTPTTTTKSVFDQDAYDAAVKAAGGENPNKAARDKLYSTIRDNAFTAGKRGLDETKDVASRNNRFELFAKGLNGGSEDIDQNAILNRTYNQGLLDLGAKADAAKTDFKSNDEKTRLGLLQSIDAGMDQSSALSSAINQMQNISDKAAADAQGTNLGNLFDAANLMYHNSQARAGRDAATAWWNQYSNGSGGRSSMAARTGTISGT